MVELMTAGLPAAAQLPLRIASVTLRRINMPMREPFVTSFGRLERKDAILVELRDDEGRVGVGEAATLAAPLYSAETTESAWHVLRKYCAPAVLTGDVDGPLGVAERIGHVRGHHFAKCGLECAAWDLVAQREGRPLAQLFGGTQTSIPVGESLSLRPSMEETLEEVGLRLRQGYRRIKLKIEPGRDMDLVAAVRERFGAIPLMVDANSSYRLADASRLSELDRFELMMIEQPLDHDDLVDHAKLQKLLKTPICLDESVVSARHCRWALELGSCRIINVKPGRLGGPCESLRVHALCLEQGIPLWMGGMFETGIGRAYNLALASLPGFTLPADMSPASLFYEEDLVEPTYTVSAEGYVEVPATPGLGFPIAWDRVDRWTVDRCVT